MLQSCGTLVYDPLMRGQKVIEPFWLILKCDQRLGYYYAWLLLKQHCVKLRRPAWETHISVIRSESIKDKSLWGKDAGTRIWFEYEPIVLTNGKHYWMKVSCPKLLDLREWYGLPRTSFPQLHLTLGNDDLIQDKEKT